MRLIAALMLWFLLGGQTYPPPYPRSGTKALIDNARAQVWDVSWPKGQPSALHRHLYDMTGLYYWPGDRIITAVDGSTRNISTKAGQIQWQLKGITHIEEGTSEDPLRAVMIELKGDGPSHKVDKKDGVAAFTGSAMPLLDNERVTVWDYASGPRPNPASRHRHPMDTFVVWTEGRVGDAVFLPAGTVHADEPIGSATTATIFELK
jgi:quercetin dioxygenase-like cupin family protein